MIAVVPHERRKVEGHREPRRAVIEQVFVPPVRLLSGGEPGELPHRPEAGPIHRRVWTPGEGIPSGNAQRLGIGLLRHPIGRRVERLHVDSRTRAEKGFPGRVRAELLLPKAELLSQPLEFFLLLTNPLGQLTWDGHVAF